MAKPKDSADIYRKWDTLESERNRLKRSTISEANKKNILDYQTDLSARNVGKNRVIKLSIALRMLAGYLGKDFKDVTKGDIVLLVDKINDHPTYSPYTKSDFKQTLKQFYKFLKGNGTDFPQEVKWISKTVKNKDVKTFEQLIHPDEIKNVIYCCQGIRDKAFLSLLYETGARIGEILNMKIQDFKPSDRFAKVRLYGKTGERWVMIVASVPYLNKYLEKHPFKTDLSAKLWLCEGSCNYQKPLIYVGATKIVQKAFKNAGVKKRCNPHSFRHSRATELASHLTETQMSQYFGWVTDTRQIRNYVHASGKEVDNAILKLNGLDVQTPEEKKVIIRCHRCGVENQGSNFCKDCGYALDVQTAIKIEEQVKTETNKAFELLMEISKNPELFKEFEDFRKKNKEE